MQAQNKFFAASLLFSAVTASEHINTAFYELDRQHEPIQHRRHFNLAAALDLAVDAHEIDAEHAYNADVHQAVIESSDEKEVIEDDPSNYFFEYPEVALEEEH